MSNIEPITSSTAALAAWIEPEVRILAAESSEAAIVSGADGGPVESTLS